MEKLNSQLEDFQLKLDQITNTFSGMARNAEVEDKEQKKGRQWFHLLANLGTLNLMGIGGAVMGKQDWGNFFGRMASHLGLVAVAAIFGGPVAWISIAVVEIVQVVKQQNTFKKNLREKLGKGFFPDLRNELPNMREELRKNVHAQFTEFAQQLTAGLQAKIDDTRTTQENILQERRSATFSAEVSRQRLTSIGAKLDNLLGDIRRAVSDPTVDATSDVAS
jgi:hypothetical protein